MNIALIDYDSGNLRSAQKAFERVAGSLFDVPKVLLTSNPDAVLAADYIILPGVGAFGDCAKGLRAIEGMEEALNQRVLKEGRPFLGICVGMQLMANSGTENMQTNQGVPYQGLGWIDGQVKPLILKDKTLKIPHMGWNEIQCIPMHPVLEGLDGETVYFVHSYAFLPEDEANCIAHCSYDEAFCAVIARDNMVGTQFHPEKSQRNGLTLIENFLKWCP